MVKLTTSSGTIYYLDGIKLLRVGVKPLKNVYNGSDMNEPNWEEIHFEKPPAIGTSFYYYHPTLAGCVSTPIVAIEEVETID